MLMFPFRLAFAWLYGVWERLFNRAVLGYYPPAMMRFRVSGTPSLLIYDLMGRDTYNAIKENLNGRVFDYGCGCGRVSRHIPGCCGSDLDHRAQRWCRDHLSFNGYTGTHSRFDTVICISVLSHVDQDTAVKILNEIKDLLRDNGTLIVTTHISDEDYRFKRAKVFTKYFSTASYSPGAFHSLLTTAGFDVLLVEPFQPSVGQMISVATKQGKRS